MIKCPICETEARYFCERETDSIYRCHSQLCKHLFSYPQPSEHQLLNFYAEDYYPKGDIPSYKQTHAYICRQILGWLPNIQAPFLDVGCGEGNLFHSLPSGAKKYYVGVETEKIAREKAQQKTGSLIIENLHVLKEIDKCFEIIVLNQVIEHFRDPIESLKILEQVSSRTATLFIATANSISLKARILRCKWDQIKNRTHLHLFAEASILIALQKTGWPKSVLIRTPYKYPHHGMARRFFHRVLKRLLLDGNLTLLSRKS